MNLARLGEFGLRGLYAMDVSGTEKNASGLPRGPFDFCEIKPGEVPTWPALCTHDASQETVMVLPPDRQGVVREGCDADAAAKWERTSSKLHFNRDFRLNSQPLAACLTPEPTIGGRAWPNFVCEDARWEIPIVLWANTTPGLIAFWWTGTNQQLARSSLTVSKLPELMVADPRRMSVSQIESAERAFATFEMRRLAPANEAWRDKVRQDLDRAMLVEVMGLPEEILEPLGLLRRQFCAEPSVSGTKRTGPPEMR